MTDIYMLNYINHLEGELRQYKDLVTELKQTQLRLEEEEEKFRTIANFTNDMENWISADGKLIWVSPSVERITGYSVNECMAMPNYPFPIIHPEDQGRLHEVMQKINEQPFHDIEFRLIRKDGKLIWIAVSTNPVRDKTGGKTGHRSSVRDISERKNIEERLALSEIKYRRLYESMMDGYATLDLQGNIIDFNKPFADMLGYSAEELRKLSFREITPEKWHMLDETVIYQQLRNRGYSDVYEKEYVRKDGTVFPVELRAVILKDHEGKRISMWAIAHNITERKQAEEALRQSEEQYRLITESITESIALVDRYGIIKYASNTLDLLGYQPAELMNTSSLNMAHPDDLRRNREIYKIATDKSWHEITYDIRLRNRDGQYVPVGIRARALFDDQMKYFGAVLIGSGLIQSEKEKEMQPLPSATLPFSDRRLTTRENEILRWIMEGKSTWDISNILCISERTVKFHVDRIMRKFKAVNRAHAVAIARQANEMDSD